MTAQRKTTLAGLALAALALTGCWGNRSEKPPVHIVWNMDFQDKWDPQEPTELFADHRASRPEVEGTVARGYLKDDDLLWRGRDLDGRFADRLPDGMELDAALLERGHERYNIYCRPCHDAAGMGKGTAVKRGMAAPPSLHDPRIRTMPDGQLFASISNGVRNMPAYAYSIPVNDRWAIVNYVRALELSQVGEQ